mmetsp:Transcript_19822/g.28203  ORF Transcript_19822/g.28203 Transcript_19822/m.28203 type:complete len:107 (+) Transcript_19822:303-623(+)
MIDPLLVLISIFFGMILKTSSIHMMKPTCSTTTMILGDEFEDRNRQQFAVRAILPPESSDGARFRGCRRRRIPHRADEEGITLMWQCASEWRARTHRQFVITISQQ